jgi:hypothetical protein
MFNSIVEASHLGSQADGILEISTTIKRISATWGEITTGSESATEEIRTLVEQSRTTLEAFSEASKEGLRAARSETMGSLGILREAAKCADQRGREIQAATLGLQAKIAEIGSAGNRLEGLLRTAGYGAHGNRVGAARTGAGGRAGQRDRIRCGSRGAAFFRGLHDGDGARSSAGGARRRADAGGAAEFRRQQRGAFLAAAALVLGRKSFIWEQPMPFRENGARMTLKSGEMPGFSDEGDIGSQ